MPPTVTSLSESRISGSTRIPYFVPDMPTADQVLPYLQEIDSTGWYSNFGPLGERFRHKLANEVLGGCVEADRLVLTASGTAALELALRQLELPTDTNVLIPSFTFPATATAVINCGYRPVLAPIRDDSWMLRPEDALRIMHSCDVGAVIPVAVGGAPLPVAEWSRFRNESGVPIIFDAAAAIGTQQIGADIPVVFSLHATKVLGVGEGGLLVCPNFEISERICAQSNFGFDRGDISVAGTNAKMSEYHAAVGLAQIARYEEINGKLVSIYREYANAIEPFLTLSDARLQETTVGVTPRIFALQMSSDRELSSLSNYLANDGVETRRLYGAPLVAQQGIMQRAIVLNGTHIEDCRFPVLALPFHTRLSSQDIEFIVNAIGRYVESHCREISFKGLVAG